MQVKLYPYKKWGAEISFSHVKGGVGWGHTKFCGSFNISHSDGGGGGGGSQKVSPSWGAGVAISF